jgi:hypothetical protein
MLSSTIYFFHDIRNDLKRNDLKRNDLKRNDESKKKKEFAHHIVSSSIFVMNEIAISNKIRELNSQNSFRFYIFEKAERLKIGEIGPYNLDANIVRSNAHKILLTFVKHELIYFDAYLSALSSFRKYIFQIIEGYRYLLGSIDLLVCNNLIHNGINNNTIVINSINCRPILTNFSFSIDLLNPAFNWSQYFLQIKLNRFFPVEFYLLQYQLTNSKVLSVYNIETIIKQFVKDQLTTALIDINTDVKYYNRYTNKTFEENLNEALKYWKTWDNYALSMVYLDLLKNTFNKIDNKFISYFMKLLVDNISLDPSKRNQTNKSLDLFEEMLQSLELKDFRELIRKAI